MPRPRKCRKVCCLPNNDGFVPVRGGEELTPIVLNVDEYESIRLIDREGFSQEQCGEYMRIARTTVQQIYAAARKKLADALVEGLPLRIEGGDFTLCSGNSAAYGCRNCYQKKIHPMLSKHFIEWVYVQTENGGQLRYLAPGQAPKAVFELGSEKPVAVYAYCNLHGLWMTKL